MRPTCLRLLQRANHVKTNPASRYRHSISADRISDSIDNSFDTDMRSKFESMETKMATTSSRSNILEKVNSAKKSGNLSHNRDAWKPFIDEKLDFGVEDMFTVEDLFNARVHFGHKEELLNGHMRPYIFGKRLGVLIIDLEETARLLKHALQVSAEIAFRGGIILFIHPSRQNGHIVEEAAKECGEYAYCRRWRSAIFANSQQIFRAVTRLPDLNIIFSTATVMGNKIHQSVTMSAKMLIPSIGICDTNCNPTLITYPVPGNDDSPQSIELYCKLFKQAILKGKERKKEIIELNGENYYHQMIDCPVPGQ